MEDSKIIFKKCVDNNSCCLCNRNTSDADIDTMFIVEHKNGNNISV